ncbi:MULTISPECIES: DUF397 domain-containing protein [unclassified Nocardiopsis]|jgi:hypothetical protein|uniref:DUF397 domain-containing protein n=1 Tax=unclassified Nocardiopsis TaxID=2649073 RepID=UPI00380ECBFA
MHHQQQTPRTWHKAGHSQGATNCVEVSEGATAAVRDTRNRDRGYLEFPNREWAALLATVA